MANTSVVRRSDFVALHGILLLAGFLVLPLLPAGTLRWPVPLVLPLAVYAGLVACHPTLRATVTWTRVGDASPGVLLATVLVIVASSAALVGYQVYASPSIKHLYDHIPFERMGGLIVGGAVFCVANAMLEEAVFRGVLFDAVSAACGPTVAVVVTAAAFGIGHYGGYPPGAVGAVMAGVYGLVLGWLRIYAGGLLTPVVAHICADATILALLATR